TALHHSMGHYYAHYAHGFDEPVRAFGCCRCSPREHGFGGGVGVKGVGLTSVAPVEPVGPIDLADRHACGGDLAGDRGSVGSCALDADDGQAGPGLEEPYRGAVADGRGRDLDVAERPAVGVDDGDVVRGDVSIDTAVDEAWLVVHHRTVPFCLGCAAGRGSVSSLSGSGQTPIKT